VISLAVQYFLNHRLDLNEIEWQMAEIAKKGFQGIYPHARQGLLTPYMSEDWWKVIEKILEVCRRTGTQMWIWDEDYYPSGLSGGRVVWDDPGLIARGLEFTVREVEGTGPFEVDFGPGMLLRAYAVAGREVTDITKFCGTRRQTWTSRGVQHTAYSPAMNPIGHPHWRSRIETNRFAAAWQPARPGKYTIVGVVVNKTEGLHPDILNPQSVKRFIELSYEMYFERFGKEFGKLIQGAFTDEPSPSGFVYPWTKKFPEEFQTDHGYEILDYLPHLAMDIDSHSPVIRHHYRLTQHRLQRENYVEQIGRWCEAHGITFAGHLTRTEWIALDAYYWPNELRCYKPMHIPCCDPLTASCGWKDAAAYHTGLKVASSASHLFGREKAGSDALAVIGDEASIRDLKYQLDYQMVLGINHFVIHGLGYSLDGPRKDEVPPSLFYQHTEWKHMKTLWDHVRTTCEALTGGEHVCDLAMLYPSTSLGCRINVQDGMKLADADERQIHGLVDELLGRQKDFDFIDEITLQECMTADGKLTTPEKYRTIILPYLHYIDGQTAEALLRFSRAGGKVIVIGTMPQAMTKDLQSPLKIWADASVVFSPLAETAILETLSGPKVEGPGAGDIFVLRRKVENELRTFVFNRSENDFDGTVDGRAVSIPGRGSRMLLGSVEPVEVTQGKPVMDVSAGWSVSFEPNQLPLNFWHASTELWLQKEETRFHAPGFDLLARQKDPCPEGDGKVFYHCRFMLTGEISDVRLVMEDQAVLGDWKLFVNGIRISDWKRAVVFDCRNIQAAVGQALRNGSTPTLNVITIEAEGPGRGLKEVPYLYGTFACEFRYSHLSFPFVKGAAKEFSLASLPPWNILGYPTFSGSATYRRKIDIPTTGDYVLDLGSVFDVAAVSLDAAPAKVLAWAPYRCLLTHLAAGPHDLAIEVTNPPANRNRAAHLPAGLLGPVRLILGHDPS
jgi:hypothetical protein